MNLNQELTKFSALAEYKESKAGEPFFFVFDTIDTDELLILSELVHLYFVPVTIRVVIIEHVIVLVKELNIPRSIFISMNIGSYKTTIIDGADGSYRCVILHLS